MTAPMQRAVNAAAEALEMMYGEPTDVRAHQARIAITAAYPHLFQSLHRENRELKAENSTAHRTTQPHLMSKKRETKTERAQRLEEARLAAAAAAYDKYERWNDRGFVNPEKKPPLRCSTHDEDKCVVCHPRKPRK